MTKHTDFSAPGNEGDNLLSFPNASDAPHPGEDPARDHQRPDGIPDDFQLLEDGIYQDRAGDGDDMVPVKICSPLIVKGLCRWPNSYGWGHVVEIQNPDGEWHELILEASDISANPARVLSPLVDRGLTLTTAAKAGQSVKELLAGWQPAARYHRVSHLGWVDGEFGAFTLGNGCVIGNACVVPGHVSGHVAAAMHSKGTLENWRATVAAPCSDNPLMIFAVSLAFSGPLLAVLGREGGGFHLKGEPAKGKTTIQKLAASVWGAPAFMQDWRTTDNGMEGAAAACNGSLLILNELGEADPRSLGNIIYMLANGTAKNRAQSDGTMQETKRWTIPILSSGEISLAEHMKSGGCIVKPGHEVRLINLEADTRSYGAFDELHGASGGGALAESVEHAAQKSYGLAGPAFVDHLIGKTDKTDDFERFILKFRETCMTDVDASSDGQVQRVLGRFASVALAGELATRFGLTGWQKGDARSAARELFAGWFRERDAATKGEIAEAVQRTRDYVSRNLDRFMELGTSGGQALDGWRDASWIYIRSERWQQIHADVDPVASARLHKAAGLLRTQSGNGLQFKIGREVLGRPKTYAVRSAELLSTAKN